MTDQEMLCLWLVEAILADGLDFITSGMANRREIVEQSIWTADEDRERGLGWAGEGALAVVCHEHGVPSPMEYPRLMDRWLDLQTRLGVTIEPVNGAVSVVYPGV